MKKLSIFKFFIISVIGLLFSTQFLFADDASESWSVWHEDEESGSGWSNTEITDVGDEIVHGMWGNSPNNIQKSYSNMPDHSQIKVTMRYWAVDSWDNEWGRVYIDNVLIWDKQRTDAHSCANGWSTYTGNFTNPWNGNNNNHKCYFDVEVIIEHTSDNFVLKAASTINQGEADEAWGFNNLVIETYGDSNCTDADNDDICDDDDDCVGEYDECGV
ncbi:MAG TPA: hypothetical protein EYQ40_07870, partial [Candidatus Marinimicrobia bacterium]|nr:hypothetical protein [Candidatus Neomarinimicrobiota bacterium]